MQITLFGVIWFISIAFVLFVYKKINADAIKRIAYILFLGMIFQCNNIIVLGNTAVGIQIVSASVFAVLLLFRPKNKNVKVLFRVGNNPIPTLSLFFAIFEFLFLLNMFINKTYLSNVFGVLMILIYLFVAYEFLAGRLKISKIELFLYEDVIVITILVIGVFQMLCKLNLLPIDGLLKVLVYNDNDKNVIFNSKSVSAFYSTFMEPSYCGTALVGFWICYACRERSRKNITLSVALVVAILLTRSSAAFIGFAVAVMGMLFVKSKSRFYKYVVPFFILCLCILFVSRGAFINELIFDKFSTASYKVRTNWNIRAFNIFSSNPVFGVGYGNSRASSLLITLLAELGIINSFAYILVFVYFIKNTFFNRFSSIVSSHAFMVLIIIICQFIACPDLNFSAFWLSIYLFGLSLNLIDE